MEQLSLPAVSEELGTELDKNPLLQSDKNSGCFVSWFSVTSMAGRDGDRYRPLARDRADAVTIGVDLSEMATVGDLQGGIEEAERLLGYKVVPLEEPVPKP